MKYGIQSTSPDGTLSFVSSTRFSKGHYSDDITNTALFVQEKSAVDALKELRRNGAEEDGRSLSVIVVNFVVDSVIEVARPKKQEGFVLTRSNDKNHGYFCGTKTAKNRDNQWADPNGFSNKERATIFATEEQAAARRDALVRTAQSYRDYTMKNGPRYSFWSTQQADEEFNRNLERHDKDITAMQNLRISAA